MVPADSDRISRVPPYSGYFNESRIFRLQDYHLLRFSFPTNSAILKISYSYIKVLQPQSVDWFGLFPFRSPLLRESIFSFFSSGYLDVSVHRVAVRITMYSLYDVTTLLVTGSPIRKSPDQSYLQLPEAYRCSSRPSSASSAKASTMRPY